MLWLLDKDMSSMKSVVVGLALAAMFVACAAAPQRSGMAVPPVSSHGSDAGMTAIPGSEHAQIEQLMGEIESSATSPALGMTVAPSADAVCSPTCDIQPMAVKPPSQDAACTHGSGNACTQACTLADTICGDAEKICDIAKKLANDAWAAGKCESAQTSCTDAHARCCDCT
jgi:hypothetical protein